MYNQKKSRRWTIILIILIAACLALVIKLYDLTIKKGDYYRDLSENKRMKNVEITAPRGNIYDRNGVLLAGTRSSFAVRAYKDELGKLDTKKRNQIYYDLIHFMERDGADYLTEYPISLNGVMFEDKASYLKEKKSPMDLLEDRLVKKNLLGPWLQSVYKVDGDSSYKFSPAARALTAFSIKGSGLPIKWDPDKDFALRFVKNDQYEKLSKQGVIRAKDSPLSVLVRRLKENNNILSQTLNHPASRKLAYDLLKKEGASDGLKLVPIYYTYENDLVLNKASLQAHFPGITWTSTAKDDFVHIVKDIALKDFLQSMSVDEENHFIIPAEKLMNLLSAKGVESNLKYTIQEDASQVIIEFEKAEKTEEKPLDRLIKLGKEYGLLDQLIVDDETKSLAEQAMFKNGVYPSISIEDWTYTSEKNQADFLKAHDLEEMEVEEAFEKLKKDNGLEKAPDDLVNLGCLVINNRVNQQGNYAYAPINLCYELTPETVALIEENVPNNSGIIVSREPIRYYPMGETACHILGYIGPISSDQEVQHYIKEKNYLPNELIGKTGVEESFEETLHGVNGKEVVLVDKDGNRTDTVKKIEAKPGNSLYLSIDAQLQTESEEALKRTITSIQKGGAYDSKWVHSFLPQSPSLNSGANISVDPNTGALLALASYPMYDPNLFVTGISASDWDMLRKKDQPGPNTPRPLMNLATQTAVQPGSSFKTVVSLAALEKGLDPQDTITCSGRMVIDGRPFDCLIYTKSGMTHGPLTLYDALGVSCNYYFYTLGLGYDPAGNHTPGIHVTVEDIQKITKKLGLDQTSGLEINIPNEAANNIPSRAKKLGTTKALLEGFLKSNLEAYIKEGTFKNKSDLKKDIATIIDWAENDPGMARSKLIDQLEGMGYEAETPLEGNGAGLADIIKYTYFTQVGWTDADSLNTMIGQGTNEFTPISMVEVASIIANQGTDYNISLVKEIRSPDDGRVLFRQSPKGRETGIKKSSFEAVTEGMARSANYTSGLLSGMPVEICSKTGTAEKEGIDPRTGETYAPYTWLIGFAPRENPKIASCLFLPNGNKSWGLAPMMVDIMSSYFDLPTIKDQVEGGGQAQGQDQGQEGGQDQGEGETQGQAGGEGQE